MVTLAISVLKAAHPLHTDKPSPSPSSWSWVWVSRWSMRLGVKMKIEWLWLWREVALAMINVPKMAGIVFGEE